MTFRFDAFELNQERRELRLRGREVVVEPLVFDLLLDLVRHRDRVVTKDELLDRVWHGAIVTEGSLQRAISLARSALRAGGQAEAIRTHPRIGYRFAAEVVEAAASQTPAPSAAPAGLAEGARREFEGNQWAAALDGFERADRAGDLADSDLERAAWCLLNLGRPEEAVAWLERAAAAQSAAGDSLATVRAAVLLTQIHLEGRRMIAAGGWQQRAARLLDPSTPCRELAQFEWITARLALTSGKFDEAMVHGERALALSREIEDFDLEAVCLIYLGHVCVASGLVRRGLELLDEAAAAVLGGDVAPWFAGLVYCGLVYICQNRGDWTRASDWTDGFSRWSDRATTITFPAVCRLHRAEVLTLKGDLVTAERELQEVRDELERSAPWGVGDAERLYGDVLRVRGDLDAAEQAYRRARVVGWDPCPGWADLLIERGDAAEAARALERAVEDPSWPCRQRRRLLLAALARAWALAGDPAKAHEALTRADTIEDGEITPAQHAALERARGEVAAAEGRTDEAIRTLRAALRSWRELGTPMETAALHERIAELLHAAGDSVSATLEIEAAEALWRKAGALARAEACASRIG
jgi:DNA-binding winged helix-turn-helix (wHTH) protein/ATP/maltotriose-dependent transcriptional regulator MalT